MESSDPGKQAAVSLLEDRWFFGNSFNRKSGFLRCNSDPSSSNRKGGMLGFDSSLDRTPSLPPCFCGEGAEVMEEEPRMGDLIRQAMPCGSTLVRTRSLQPRKEMDDGGAGTGGSKVSRRDSISLPEKGGPMNRLTRRTSADSSTLLPPRHSSSTEMKQDFRAPKSRPSRTTAEINDTVRYRNFGRSKSLKRTCDLEHEELQGFKDLGFDAEEESLSSSAVDILSELQIEDNVKQHRRKAISSPELFKPWQAPPIPSWVDTDSAKDVKEQIKFWARAVASNLREKC
ncbi:hypothetical protein Nepgr_027400 [Nepenthes gracilis]|uniref:Uncharacterized protein n=1 Tax=Nepenthes gracilis TaxID=150966 RepID=A0AAD3Y176_NEPGR|nr:hypothetical protein Nepgr_027400 [Nepenthes gracilis]